MNKAYKVVFNKVRGTLMVVNEATSSIQKKGAKTVVATAVMTSLAASVCSATGLDVVISDSYTIENGVKTSIQNVSNTQPYENTSEYRPAGLLIDTTDELSYDEIKVFVDATKEGNLEPKRVYGVAIESKGEKLTVGNLFVETRVAGGAQNRAFRNNKGKTVLVTGDADIRSFDNNIDHEYSYGVDSWTQGVIDFQGNTSIFIQSATRTANGTYICDGSKLIFSGDKTEVTAKTTSELLLDPIEGPHPDGYGQWANAIYTSGTSADGAGVHFTNGKVTLTALNDPNDNKHSTSTALRSEGYGQFHIAEGVDLMTMNATSHRGEAMGIWTSYFSQAELGGNEIRISAQTDSGAAFGHYNAWATTVEYNAKTVQISAKSASGGECHINRVNGFI